MKILMTGMSTRTVGSTRLKLNYLNFNPLLKLALEEMGHVVDQGRILVDQDLSSYEAAFIHVNPLDKIVCQNVAEVCYALETLGDRAIIFLEDWVSVELRRSWEHVLDVRWEKWKKWKQLDFGEMDAKVRQTLRDVLEGRWPVIANFYGWGNADHFFSDNFKDASRCMIIDPSPMAVVPDFKYAPRSTRWILATLQKHDTWVSKQNLTWPIEHYGNERQGYPAIPESEVTQLYAESWGVLAPRYPVTGWFRPRFLLAAATGSVLYCDPSEGRALGEPYSVPVSLIERMDRHQLEALAEEQKQLLTHRCWTKGQLLEALSLLLQGATV